MKHLLGVGCRKEALTHLLVRARSLQHARAPHGHAAEYNIKAAVLAVTGNALVDAGLPVTEASFVVDILSGAGLHGAFDLERDRWRYEADGLVMVVSRGRLGAGRVGKVLEPFRGRDVVTGEVFEVTAPRLARDVSLALVTRGLLSNADYMPTAFVAVQMPRIFAAVDEALRLADGE